MNYIYGAGAFGKILGEYFTETKKDYLFIDRYSKQKKCNSVPIVFPEDISPSSDDFIYNTVLPFPITSCDDRDILEYIEKLGFTHNNIFSFKHICEEFPLLLTELVSDGFMWRKGPCLSILWNEEKCSKIKSIFSDEMSIKLFNKIESFRKLPSIKNYIWPSEGKQYIDNNIANFFSSDTFNIIELGAWQGDTILDFYHYFSKKINSYLAFEPCKSNLTQLSKLLSDSNKISSTTKIFPVAVGNVNDKLLFDSSSGSASALSENGDTSVDVVKLDDYIPGHHFNLLKMDIEGAEYEALRGAEEIIKKNQPHMMISLYHCPEDLWRIPDYIYSLMPNAKFYLRQHHHWGLELTLYVKP